jgi:hypothetical protein
MPAAKLVIDSLRSKAFLVQSNAGRGRRGFSPGSAAYETASDCNHFCNHFATRQGPLGQPGLYIFHCLRAPKCAGRRPERIKSAMLHKLSLARVMGARSRSSKSKKEHAGQPRLSGGSLTVAMSVATFRFLRVFQGVSAHINSFILQR